MELEEEKRKNIYESKSQIFVFCLSYSQNGVVGVTGVCGVGGVEADDLGANFKKYFFCRNCLIKLIFL